MYIYVCTYTYVYVYMCVRVRVKQEGSKTQCNQVLQPHIYIYVYIYIHTYIHTYMCAYIYIHIYQHVYIHNPKTCIHVYMCICIHVYTCIFIHIYIHVSTCMYARACMFTARGLLATAHSKYTSPTSPSPNPHTPQQHQHHDLSPVRGGGEGEEEAPEADDQLSTRTRCVECQNFPCFFLYRHYLHKVCRV